MVNWTAILAHRSRRLLLTEVADRSPADVARAVNGLQAQVASYAAMAAWLRTHRIDEQVLTHALETERSLVKTWAARGTLHLLPADDLPLWCAALSTRRIVTPSWLRYHGVEAHHMAEIERALPQLLADGTPRTRIELADALAEAAGDPALRERVRSGWGAVLKPAAARGLICFGPQRGQHVTFVAPRAWLHGWHDVEPDAGVDEVVRRCLDRFGPMTADELHRWSALDPPVVRRSVRRLDGQLVPLTVDGERRLALAATVEELRVAGSARPPLRLLPAFDPYTLAGLRHLDRLLPDPARKAAVSRAQGWISPVVVDAGRVVGTWDVVRGQRAVVTVTPFARLTRAQHGAVEREAAAWERLWGTPVDVDVTLSGQLRAGPRARRAT